MTYRRQLRVVDRIKRRKRQLLIAANKGDDLTAELFHDIEKLLVLSVRVLFCMLSNFDDFFSLLLAHTFLMWSNDPKRNLKAP